jgi:X-X-X-Leu-X-X-Gly heptad repeat protein
MIPGFEDSLIGKKVGKKYTINVTFPKDYQAAELAGKDAEFDVTINSKQQLVTPDYDEAFIKSVSKFDNKKDYEKSVKKELTKKAKEDAETQLQEDLWAKVLAKTKVKKYPKGMIKDETEIQKVQYQRMADQYGMSPEAMGITEDQYKSMAKESLKEKLALHAIVKKEGIKVKRSDMEDFYNGIIDYTDAVGQAAQGAKRLDDSATALLEGSVELNDGAKALSEGVETLGDGTGELVDGADQLDDGASALYDGAGQLADGSGALLDGVQTLCDSKDDLVDGAYALFEGAVELDDGMNALKDGLEQLDEAAIQKLVDLIDGDFRTLSDRTEAMLDLMNDYPSYGGRSEEMSGVTAFVIRTEAVEAAEESVTDR